MSKATSWTMQWGVQWVISWDWKRECYRKKSGEKKVILVIQTKIRFFFFLLRGWFRCGGSRGTWTTRGSSCCIKYWSSNEMRINGWLVVLIMNAITMISQNLLLRIKKKRRSAYFLDGFCVGEVGSDVGNSVGSIVGILPK